MFFVDHTVRKTNAFRPNQAFQSLIFQTYEIFDVHANIFFFLTKLSHFEQFSCFLPKKCSFRTVLSRLIHLLSKNKSFGSKDEWGRLSTVLNEHFFTNNNVFFRQIKWKIVKIMDPKQQNMVDYINEKDLTFWDVLVKNMVLHFRKNRCFYEKSLPFTSVAGSYI